MVRFLWEFLYGCSEFSLWKLSFVVVVVVRGLVLGWQEMSLSDSYDKNPMLFKLLLVISIDFSGTILNVGRWDESPE
jgi:hypothetical protein